MKDVVPGKPKAWFLINILELEFSFKKQVKDFSCNQLACFWHPEEEQMDAAV